MLGNAGFATDDVPVEAHDMSERSSLLLAYDHGNNIAGRMLVRTKMGYMLDRNDRPTFELQVEEVSSAVDSSAQN
jgi:hypothetical protein